MAVAYSKLHLLRRSMPHIPLRCLWGFLPFSLRLSYVFPVFLGFPFRLFLGGMEVCQCSLRKVAACSAGGLSLPFFTSPSYQPAFPQLFVVRFRMQSSGWGGGEKLLICPFFARKMKNEK